MNTTGYTSYDIEANFNLIIHIFARHMADSDRPLINGTQSKETWLVIGDRHLSVNSICLLCCGPRTSCQLVIYQKVNRFLINLI